ncbi:MAG: nuclear transport factor 2 family protein [Rubrivivax sp.]|nr:nuclear transport factor 2 family protein [Rubrivivax sp.]MDP3083332.1 nuclear transport factor 2 family protein [Rubrivivax sp.]
MKTTPTDPRVARIVQVFETLKPADVAALDRIYQADASFKDPFNEVQGLAKIQRIFEHMFATLEQPRFRILDAVVDGDQVFLRWDFLFRMKRFQRDAQCIHGGSYLRLAADGRITLHRDYWDAAEELYEKLPLLGGLMRWLKRRAAR